MAVVPMAAAAAAAVAVAVAAAVGGGRVRGRLGESTGSLGRTEGVEKEYVADIQDQRLGSTVLVFLV